MYADCFAEELLPLERKEGEKKGVGCKVSCKIKKKILNCTNTDKSVTLFLVLFSGKRYKGQGQGRVGNLGGGEGRDVIYFFDSRNKRMLRRKGQARKRYVGCSQTSTKRAGII